MTYAEREAIERLNRETLKAKGIIYGGDVSESAMIKGIEALKYVLEIESDENERLSILATMVKLFTYPECEDTLKRIKESLT